MNTDVCVLFEPQPRVEEPVGDVGEQVAEDEGRRVDEHGRPHHGPVAVGDRGNCHVAEPGPLEDDLDVDGPGEDVADHEAGEGGDRNEGVLQHDPVSDGPFCSP